MKYNYSRQRLKLNNFNAILFVILAVVEVIRSGGITGFFSIFLVFLAALSVFNIFYELKYQYLTLEDGWLRVNHLFGKKIRLEDLRVIEKNSSGLILRSDKKTFKVNKVLIDQDSLNLLEKELRKLNVEWNKD